MSKQIIVIGGGISGLSVLHGLQKKYVGREDIQIRLVEKDDHVGGTAHTERHENWLFEWGPSGFLDNSPATLSLAKDLGLEKDIIQSNGQAKRRFICLKEHLHELPSSPFGLFGFKPLSVLDKIRLFGELFVPKGRVENETLYNFAARRFGENAAKYLFDPMAAGIFGGDAKHLTVKEAFPKIFDLEQKYGSLIKGMMKLGGQRKKLERAGGKGAAIQGQLLSFKGGMGQICEQIWHRYRENIQLGEEAVRIDRVGEGYSVETKKIKYFADEVYVCVPAYVASKIIKSLNTVLAEFLEKVHYVPVAVIGLVYHKSNLSSIPGGFGYLTPSSEKTATLGVLFPGNVFSGRVDEDHFLFHVMLGGTRAMDMAHREKEEIILLAKNEVERVFSLRGEPAHVFRKIWAKAIPQYDQDYALAKEGFLYALEKFPNFHLVANYLGGVSFNQCVENAGNAAEGSVL